MVILYPHEIEHIPYSIYPRYWVEIICVGFPKKLSHLHLIRSFERVERVSARKVKWKCTFDLSMN